MSQNAFPTALSNHRHALSLKWVTYLKMENARVLRPREQETALFRLFIESQGRLPKNEQFWAVDVSYFFRN